MAAKKKTTAKRKTAKAGAPKTARAPKKTAKRASKKA